MSELTKNDICLSVKDQQDMTKRIHPRLEAITPTIFEAGELLVEVHKRHLWIIYSESFREYVEDFLGWSKQRAYQIMDAVDVRAQLPQTSQQFVDSESKARALKPVPAAQRPKVVQQAAKAASVQGNGHVTARHIAEAAQRVVATKPPEKQVFIDKTGFEIPENLHNLFLRSPEVQGHLQSLSAMRAMLRRVDETRDPLWLPVNKSSAAGLVDQLYAEMKTAIPYAVCIYCQGRADTMSHCTACKGRGVLSEFFWKTAVPEEFKQVREKANKK